MNTPGIALTYPTKGRLLGIDYGTKRVGLAISSSDQTIASPINIHQRVNEQVDSRYFKTVVDEYEVAALVVGLPIHINGEVGLKAREARNYGKKLSQWVNRPVEFWDERYTSAIAEDLMLGVNMTREQRKKRVDMIAAQIMLQSFLDHRRNLLPPQSDSDASSPINEDA
ncbi:Holliday junction resolvase RuvX [Planctomicrobium sp. SH668]|uniref:Holliday junction resolvase RuvX n=1 Tax=Planctomicrobium sp. SH668 TaxID=3448126 RepID=UPI003F5B318F